MSRQKEIKYKHDGSLQALRQLSIMPLQMKLAGARNLKGTGFVRGS